MNELDFDAGLCADCPTCDCIMKCQYMEFPLEEAKRQRKLLIEKKDNDLMRQCVTCYACEEYCTNKNHPFYLIVSRQEEFDIHPVPRPIERSQVIAMEPQGRIRKRRTSDPVINMCSFPMMKGGIRGSLFAGTSLFWGLDIFCNLMYLHFARNSTIGERLPLMIENIVENYLDGERDRDVICYHDECYGTYTSWADAFGIDVPFRPVHLFEYLHSKLLTLSENIKPLGLDVAYQRPCSNRLCPETDHFVDDIFALIGANRPAREYEYENALCCGGPLEIQQQFDLVKDIRKRNIDDMVAAGVTHCVFNCPFCMWTLAESVFKAGMIPVMMSDLCLQALGE